MTSFSKRRGRQIKFSGLASVISFALLAAACGSSSKSAGSATTAGAAAGGTSAPTKKATLKIGGVFSLSGAVAPFSEGAVNAVNLAVKQINSAGGFAVGDTNYTLDVSMKDDRSDPAIATAAATQLVDDEGVNIVFGPSVSVTASAAAQLLVPKGVLEFSPSNSTFSMLTPELAAGANHTFFNTSSDPKAETSFHEQALKLWYPNVKTVAVLYDDGAVGKGTGPLFTQAAKNVGLKVVDEETYPAATTDFSTVLTTIKGTHPDLLFVCCTSTTNSLIVKQSIELNVAPAFISKGGSLRPPTSDATGGAISLPYVSTIAPGELEILKDGTVVAPRPGYAQYLKDLKTVLGKDPSANESTALYTYDYVFMLVEAMKVAGTVKDTKAIADALEKLKFNGPAMGPISYSSAHFAQVDADTCLVTNGKVDCKVLPFGG
jgi:branched-chain amino acid transport system substrate-binding protein